MIPTPHIVTVLRGGSKDEWGIVQPESIYQYKGYVQSSSSIKKIVDGKEVQVSLNISLKGYVDITYQDYICFEGVRRKPISIEPMCDLSGRTICMRVLV